MTLWLSQGKSGFMAAVRALDLSEASRGSGEKGNWATVDSSYQEVSWSNTDRLSSCLERGSCAARAGTSQPRRRHQGFQPTPTGCLQDMDFCVFILLILHTESREFFRT